MKETDRYLKEKFAETDRKIAEEARLMKALRVELNGIAHSNGKYAESYFYNCFKKNHFYFAEQKFQVITRNLFLEDEELGIKDEFDLVLTNCHSVTVIEIKYKAKLDDVEQTLRKAETFKILCPQYKDFTLYLGLAGLHIEQNAEQEAQRQGIAVIKQVGESMVVYDKNLRRF
jgi:hypothetical protein